MKYEMKIIGINPIWISALLTGVFLIISSTGGQNAPWGYIGFEVIFPFYMSVVIGEWCKTRTDPMFEVIISQGKSFFGWIVRRFSLLFAIVTAFSVVGMFGMKVVFHNISVLELLAVFLPTAFLLATMSVFFSLLSSVPHIPTMLVGVLWLFSIMSISLLRLAPVRYFYLFAYFAGVNSSVCVLNKSVLFLIGSILWGVIYIICKKRLWGVRS